MDYQDQELEFQEEQELEFQGDQELEFQGDQELEFQGDQDDEEISSEISDLFSSLSFEEQIELFEGGSIDENEEPEDADVSDKDELSDEDDQDYEEYDTIEKPYYDENVQEKIEEVKEEESLNYDDDFNDQVLQESGSDGSIELSLSQIEAEYIYQFENSICLLVRTAGRVLFIGQFSAFISSSFKGSIVVRNWI
ncbi:MAG: hypothetical protein EZS28_025355 [Streblomastix strix]|uniref:Uncharacterized protein n=1 Tax=Streblomastix strix TaxID=222440 RepID=A0A5J4V9D0_9EUKA|nr:MAG: hypothetical protein EZS28_025355 [Streblomastix strix]